MGLCCILGEGSAGRGLKGTSIEDLRASFLEQSSLELTLVKWIGCTEQFYHSVQYTLHQALMQEGQEVQETSQDWLCGDGLVPVCKTLSLQDSA